MIYIFDIDGTLANLEHRLPFIKSDPPDWERFFAACWEDEPIRDVIYLLRVLHEAGHRIVLVTGRSDECAQLTNEWMNVHAVPHSEMYMRLHGDHRPDSEVKAELLDRIIADWPSEKIVGVFEDRKQVVDMYRAKGLRVFQVADGNF